MVTVLFLKRLLARRRDLSGHPADPLAAFLGPLEIRVLESLWRRGESSSVRDLEEDFPGSAYTTLMTTLDRLFKKGLLERSRRERAFLYSARYRRVDLERELAKGEIARLLGFAPDRRAARPILSTFVDAVGEKDALLLEELEKLVRARRKKPAARDGEPR
jgi:predicted transcriptional regulator